jgi:hypothetical protein
MSRTVRVLRIHQVRAEAVAEDLRADMLLGERQRHPAIAGADQVGFFQIDRERDSIIC